MILSALFVLAIAVLLAVAKDEPPADGQQAAAAPTRIRRLGRWLIAR